MDGRQVLGITAALPTHPPFSYHRRWWRSFILMATTLVMRAYPKWSGRLLPMTR